MLTTPIGASTNHQKSCSTCVRRKTRCSRTRPSCTTCTALRLPCAYPVRPALVICMAVHRPTPEQPSGTTPVILPPPLPRRRPSNEHVWRVQLHALSAHAFFPRSSPALPQWCVRTSAAAAGDPVAAAALDASCLLQLHLVAPDRRLEHLGRDLYGRSLAGLRRGLVGLMAQTEERGPEARTGEGSARVQTVLCTINSILVCEALQGGRRLGEPAFAHSQVCALLSAMARRKGHQDDGGVEWMNFCAFRVWTSLCTGSSIESGGMNYHSAFLRAVRHAIDILLCTDQPKSHQCLDDALGQIRRSMILAHSATSPEAWSQTRERLSGASLETLVEASVYLGCVLQARRRQRKSAEEQTAAQMLMDVIQTLLQLQFGFLGAVFAAGPLRFCDLGR